MIFLYKFRHRKGINLIRRVVPLISCFCNMKRLGVFLLPLDGILVYRRFAPSILSGCLQAICWFPFIHHVSRFPLLLLPFTCEQFCNLTQPPTVLLAHLVEYQSGTRGFDSWPDHVTEENGSVFPLTNSPFVFPYISYKSSGEKLLKYP